MIVAHHMSNKGEHGDCEKNAICWPNSKNHSGREDLALNQATQPAKIDPSNTCLIIWIHQYHANDGLGCSYMHKQVIAITISSTKQMSTKKEKERGGGEEEDWPTRSSPAGEYTQLLGYINLVLPRCKC